MTPILPFKNPPAALPIKATQIFDANPTMSKLIIVPKHPMSRTGFLPILSESAPHAIPVRASARAKEEMRRPA